MNKLSFKKKLVDICIMAQNRVVEHAKSRMDEAQKSANEYGQPQDRYDSYRTQMLGKRDMFAKQYCKAVDERNILDRIDLVEENKTVAFGSVVITENQKLFISISLGKINVDGKHCFAISPLVPLFKALEGLKKGDTFEFNGKQQKITDLF